MKGWPDKRILDLLGIELPIIQAPMAGPAGSTLVAAVSGAGGLGSLPCAMLGAEQIRAEVAAIRSASPKPLNLKFFCHVFTGRPARSIVNRAVRELGPMSVQAPAFPRAAVAMAPLRAKTEPVGSPDFVPLWSGQAAGLCRAAGAAELTRRLAAEALAKLRPGA